MQRQKQPCLERAVEETGDQKVLTFPTNCGRKVNGRAGGINKHYGVGWLNSILYKKFRL